MKFYRLIILLMLLVGFLISGCASPGYKPVPRTPEKVYDDYPPGRSAPLPDKPVEKPGVADPPKAEYPVDEHRSLPPRIGEPDDIRSDSDLSESHLLAAVTPLEAQAKKLLAQGHTDQAFATAERAIRIDPSNAKIWNLMAIIQLDRGNFNQAEQLARKSNLLSKSDKKLRAGNWRIIAEALARSGRAKEAENALQKAREMEKN